MPYRLRPNAHTFRDAQRSVRLEAPAVRRAYKTLLTSTDRCARSGWRSGALPISMEFTVLGRIVLNQPVSYHIDLIRRITLYHTVSTVSRVSYRIMPYRVVSTVSDVSPVLTVSVVSTVSCRIMPYQGLMGHGPRIGPLAAGT